MDDLEVEVVTDLSTDDAAQYVLYGGKGGVGKTTMAAATGVASADEGTETLVVSTDPAHSLSDVYRTDLGPTPSRVPDYGGLWAVEIEPETALERATLFDDEGGFAIGGLGDLLGDDEEVPMPGADEAAAVQQLLRFLDDERFDRVVVDTAPTGHTLRLLELPSVLDSILGRLLQVRDRLSDLGGILGDEGDGPDLAATRDRIERLTDILRDPTRTDFRLVMVPETLSVRETRRLRDRLERNDIPVGTLVVNRVMEPPEEVADVVGGTLVAPDLQGCAFCKRRWQVQQTALDAAQELFREMTVYRVPLLADPVDDPTALEVVATCLT